LDNSKLQEQQIKKQLWTNNQIQRGEKLMTQQSNEKHFFERQLVIFKIGNEEFGVDISDVREIIKSSEVPHLRLPLQESSKK